MRGETGEGMGVREGMGVARGASAGWVGVGVVREEGDLGVEGEEGRAGVRET